MLGVFWAFERGGNDFNVFYSAWKLVLAGKGSGIYGGTTDRYLYAPGFAWILCPFGLLPRDLALATWCLLKALCLGFVLRALAMRLVAEGFSANHAWGAAGWGMIFVARPLLIDFQYGQVNAFILAACLGAFLTKRPWGWAWLTFAAIAKLFPLLLLVVPFSARGREWRSSRLAIIVVGFVVLLSPVLASGWAGARGLYQAWLAALVGRGFPLESHNQSFAAFLSHYFSGAETPVIADHAHRQLLLFGPLSAVSIGWLSVAWSLLFGGLGLGWLMRVKPPIDSLRWVAISLAWIVIPLHLAWKPYFVMTYPLAVWAIAGLAIRVGPAGEASAFRRAGAMVGIAIGFTAINLTGYDLLGHDWAGRLEAASLFLWVHLGLLFWSLSTPYDRVRGIAVDRVA